MSRYEINKDILNTQKKLQHEIAHKPFSCTYSISEASLLVYFAREILLIVKILVAL